MALHNHSSTDPYVQVGRSGLFVYRVALGTMQFGWSVDEEGSFDVLDAYAGMGGNFIDTADVYSAWSAVEGGPPNAGGVSEEIIGRWLKSRGNRDDMVIATKVRGAMGELFADHRGTAKQREGLSRRWIMKACDDSLRRLGVDHIDLYQAHWFDPWVPSAETMSAFADLVRAGKVRYLGVSNWSAWRIVQALWEADRRDLEPIVSAQPEYNLLSPTRSEVEMELAPMCVEHGIGLVPYSPLGGGLLTGKYRRHAATPDSVRAGRADQLSDHNWDIIDTLVSVAEREDMTPAHAAIDWLRTRPAVAAPIVGANRPDQLRDSIGSLDRRLSSEALDELNTASDFHRSRAAQEI